VFTLNVDKQGGRGAIFSSLGVAIAVATFLAAAPAQVQTDDTAVNLVSGTNGKCLQPINQSHTQGDAIVQQTCNGSTAQQWTVRTVSDSAIHVINRDSGLCLDARGKAVDGTPIQQWPCNQISNENWRRGGTNNMLVSGISDTWSHCVASPGNQDGLAMELRQCSGASSQVWNTEHAASAVCAGNSGNSPLDLTWTACDQNGFPFNPEMQYQVTTGGQVILDPTSLCPAAVSSHVFLPPCVRWPVTYDNGDLCGPHVNYFAVSYQGPTYWWQKSAWGTDSDYNFFLNPSNEGGFPHPQQIEIEFDSQETINYFRSPLWSRFHDMVDNKDNSVAQAYFSGQTGVVTALFGLDCGHSSCGLEAHPAYALAVNTSESNVDDDQWAVFARNWGNEGFCASQEHTLPVSDLKLVIPWLTGATAVTVQLPNSHFNLFENSPGRIGRPPARKPAPPSPPQPQITVANGEGILIDFTLPDSSLEMGWEGEVHLQWSLPFAARAALTARNAARRAAAPVRPAEDEEKEKPENRVADLFARLPAQQQAPLRARLTAPSAAAQPAVAPPSQPLRPVLTVAKLPPPPRLARPVVPQAENNPALVQRNQAVRQALCEAYKNNVPGYPSMCTAAGQRR
jgi:hypothetical protein